MPDYPGPFPDSSGNTYVPPDGAGRLDNVTSSAAAEVLLVDEGEGTWSESDSHRYRLTFRVAMTDPLATAFDVLSVGDPLPARGDSFCRFEWSDGTRKWTTGSVIDPESVCVDRRANRDPQNPNWWLVVCEFDGRTDPTAEPPQVTYDEVPFTEHDVRDYWGGLVANTARDPIEGGMPVDRAYGTLVLVRNIAYEKWDPNLAGRYRHTRNKKPFRHSNLISLSSGAIVGAALAQVVSEPGTAKLSRLSATRMVRSLGSTPLPVAPGGVKSKNFTSYYWQLRAQIDFDDVAFPLKDGTREKRRHRWVTLNAGYRKLSADGKRTAILSATALKPTHPSLLDAQGQPLIPPPDQPPTLPAALQNMFVYPSNSTAFETQESTELRVLSPGLFGLAPGSTNFEIIPGVGQAKGNATLLDQGTYPGGWNYIPNTDQTGWDYFGYYADGVGPTGTPASPRAKGYVAILISPRPVYLPFDRYGLADWDEIASWIGDW